MRTDHNRDFQSFATSCRPVSAHQFSFQVRAMGGLPGSADWNNPDPHRVVWEPMFPNTRP